MKRVSVDRAEALDVVAAVAATVLGVVGFRTSFDGPSYLVSGVVGAVLGGAVAWLLTRAKLPMLVTAAAATLGFFAFGAAGARREAVVGVLPTPAVVADLLDGAINGWADLLTTVPPAGQEGNLLAVPYLSGYVGAAVAVVLARRMPRLPVCALPPLAVLVTSVLFGTDRPASLLLQGALFAAVLLGWLSAREAWRREVVVHRTRRGRALSAAGLVAVSAVAGLAAGPSLPFADARERYVLRDRIVPPFDPRAEPSPLAGYRNFTGVDAGDDALVEGDSERFGTVEGLPEGVPVRLAVMDSYDGLVWTVSGDGVAGAGVFEGVGDRIPGAPPGDTVEVEFAVEAEALAGVWLPAVGSPEEIRFRGGAADALRTSLRFNRSTRAAAVGAGLQVGDRYRLVGVVPEAPDPARLANSSVDPALVRPVDLELDPLFATRAAEAVSGTTSDFERATALQEFFAKGFYSDGGAGLGVPPGHSLARLGQLLENPNDMRGNAEQYAAAMALQARVLGMPARVVLGFRPDAGDDGALDSENVEAWVEIAFAGAGWVPFFPTPDRTNNPPEERLPEPEPTQVRSDPPPPTTLPPPPTIPEEVELEDSEDEEDDEDEAGAGGGIPRVVVYAAAGAGIPLLAVGIPCGVVVLLKARRRRRRRSSGPPARRIAGGWVEVVDLARDMGHPVPTKATRREIAGFLGLEPVGALATTADQSTFGAADPDESVAAAYWRSVEEARIRLLGGLRRRDRLRAAVTLTSLRAAT